MCVILSILIAVVFVFVFVFFFFVKQKTAYEMRISDWSSDVCSSDLGDPPLTAVEIDEIASADIDSAGAVSDRPFVQQVEVDEARQRLAQRPGIIKAERQIGRASCRERVCQ